MEEINDHVRKYITQRMEARHIQENFDIFDFELTSEEMEQIAALNKNERLGDW